MKLIRVSMLILVLSTMLGCSAVQQNYAIQSSMIGIETNVLKAQYQSIETLLRDKQLSDETFTDEEWRKLMNMDATIDMLILKFDALTALDTSQMNLSDVEFMWRLAMEGYTQGREVIHAHWEEFQPSTQVLLNAFDQQAGMTSDRITTLLSDPSNDNINQTLVLIAGVLSLAVKMVGLAAL